MVKIKTISRDPRDYTKGHHREKSEMQRNLNPELHAFDRNREYQSAMNATKLDNVFAKPFAGNLEGHSDGIFCMRRHPTQIKTLASAACDGEVRIWDLAARKTICSFTAHSGFVRGISYSHASSPLLYTCGEDKYVKLWELPEHDTKLTDKINLKPISAWISPLDSPFTSIDNQYQSTNFVTSSASRVNVWDPERSQPILQCEWGDDTVTCVRFNPVEHNIISTTAEDRSLRFFDIRSSTPMKRLEFDARPNILSWNPVNPNILSIASDDMRCYTFDMRFLDQALQVHLGHTAAVYEFDIALDYSPTGQEFVTGSTDKTVRIYKDQGRDSSNCYYTKRMQRVFSLQYSGDSHYIFCGSDDTNIRVWKSAASRNTAIQNKKMKRAEAEQNALMEKYSHMSEISKIRDRKHVPINIKRTTETLKLMDASEKRKRRNVLAHTSQKNGENLRTLNKKKAAIVQLES